jgi:hypothetical protein
MQLTRPPDPPGPAPPGARLAGSRRPGRTRLLARSAVAALALSVALMAAVGLLGPSAAVPRFPAAAPWPPYFAVARPSELVVALLTWIAVAVGGLGLAAGLLAVRDGWRPSPRRLAAGGALAVVALVLTPPTGSTDMMDYAAYGRIAVLGHSPYRMTPGQLRSSGDPVGAVVPPAWRHVPSVYGPLATASEAAAAALAGPSPARTVFWLKAWNGLAYLAVALALDRLLRRDRAGRARAHLLWTVNPLMLLAVMGGGHIDGLAAAAGFLGLLCLRPAAALAPAPALAAIPDPDPLPGDPPPAASPEPAPRRPGLARGLGRGLAAGVLIGAAIAIKAPFALYLVGLGWAARRSPRTLAAAAVGVLAVLLPSYLVAGRAAVSAVASRATGTPDLYQPWQLLSRALGVHQVTAFDDTAGLVATAILAAILLWRLPAGPAALPFARPALAVCLAWLVCSPQQRPWYDAMIFPLVALLPATRLDWLVLARGVAAALAELPGVRFYTSLRPDWLSRLADGLGRGIVPAALVIVALALVWLCVTGRWGSRPAAVPPAIS